MAETDSPFVNVAMWSGGRYSTANKAAKDLIDSATPLVLDAIRRMPDASPSSPFTLTDMGCADGGVSVDMIRRAAAAVRARWPGRPIMVVYEDQPRNDFNSLFHLIHGLSPAPTYLNEIEDVSVLASASSFYRPIVPAGTLHLGFSASAMHWLSRKPCDLTNHIQAVGATGAELAAFAEQGRGDWEAILLQRARELVPGGRLVLVNFCKDEAGRYVGNAGGVSTFATFNTLWQRFTADGVISRDEYVRITFPEYYKTVEEFTQPLADAACAAHRAGLRLEHCETRVLPCPFAAEFRQHGDAARFAHEFIAMLRSWTESTFLGALAPNRPLDERRAIIDSYYGTYEALVRENPVGHGHDLVHIYMTIAKISA